LEPSGTGTGACGVSVAAIAVPASAISKSPPIKMILAFSWFNSSGINLVVRAGKPCSHGVFYIGYM